MSINKYRRVRNDYEETINQCLSCYEEFGGYIPEDKPYKFCPYCGVEFTRLECREHYTPRWAYETGKSLYDYVGTRYKYPSYHVIKHDFEGYDFNQPKIETYNLGIVDGSKNKRKYVLERLRRYKMDNEVELDEALEELKTRPDCTFTKSEIEYRRAIRYELRIETPGIRAVIQK